jgi:hypothetical protein
LVTFALEITFKNTTLPVCDRRDVVLELTKLARVLTVRYVVLVPEFTFKIEILAVVTFAVAMLAVMMFELRLLANVLTVR